MARLFHLQVGARADDGVLEVAVVVHSDAVHEHAVDDLDAGAQLAVGPEHTALDGALVPHGGADADHAAGGHRGLVAHLHRLVQEVVVPRVWLRLHSQPLRQLRLRQHLPVCPHALGHKPCI